MKPDQTRSRYVSEPTLSLDTAVAQASSPASVGNVGVGFDILGHSVAGASDYAQVRLITEPTVRVTDIHGIATELPRQAHRNTAGMALLTLRKELGLHYGFELTLYKGIALGSGMGGSAASCVAALVAANALLDRPLSRQALYRFALAGEAVASGSCHGDNIGPMLLGGMVLSAQNQLLRIPLPQAWHVALVHPHYILETRRSRAILDGHYVLNEFVAQSAQLALFLAGCYRGEARLVRQGLRDVLVEPRRASLIPDFHRVKQAALDHHAMGASISGGGPSLFGWYECHTDAEAAGQAMQAVFSQNGLDSDMFVAPIDSSPAACLVDETIMP